MMSQRKIYEGGDKLGYILNDPRLQDGKSDYLGRKYVQVRASGGRYSVDSNFLKLLLAKYGDLEFLAAVEKIKKEKGLK